MDNSDAFRYAMDNSGLVVASVQSIAQYHPWVVQVQTSSISSNQVNSANRIVLLSRITVGSGYFFPDGYNPLYAPDDGYCYPMIHQEDNTPLTMENGELNATTVILGPLVYPYCFNNITGGFDPTIFQPRRIAGKTIQNFIQILGPGLSTTGNLFRVAEVRQADLSHLSYKLKLVSTGTGLQGEIQ